jgi:hypothetical protein
MDAQTLTVDQKWNIIASGIPRGKDEADHVIGEEEIRDILKERDLRLYWGTGGACGLWASSLCSSVFPPPPSHSDHWAAASGLLCTHVQDCRLLEGLSLSQTCFAST